MEDLIIMINTRSITSIGLTTKYGVRQRHSITFFLPYIDYIIIEWESEIRNIY